MRKCKYIDKGLGVKYKVKGKSDSGYGWTWSNPNKKEKKQRKKYGFDSRECFNLNDEFELWLYAHLKMYLHDAKKIVNLDFYKFTVTTLRYEKMPKVEREVLDFSAKTKTLCEIPTKKAMIPCYKKVYEDKELTQKQCIKLMLKYLEKIWKYDETKIADYDNEKTYIDPPTDYSQLVIDIWAKVYQTMWW